MPSGLHRRRRALRIHVGNGVSEGTTNLTYIWFACGFGAAVSLLRGGPTAAVTSYPGGQVAPDRWAMLIATRRNGIT
jgi:hypothetical protein